MRKILENILLNQAKKIIARHKPVIIAVTGSFGKTATKDAIFAVLDDKSTVRQSIKNYNNELGVPLTIIGEEAPGSSLMNWLSLLLAGRRALSDENYPKTLILEMAADRPGDLQKLVDVAAPKISIVTAVGPVHLEYFLTEKNIVIIDDTYNASPVAVLGAITVLKQAYPKARTWAVLGDMMELGGDSQNMHEEIGKHVFKTGIDYLVAVGERSKGSARAALQTGMNEDKIFRFEKPEDAGKFLEDEIIPGDVLLVKGSQGARMEKIVKELMANPLDAPMLLVRQGKGWE